MSDEEKMNVEQRERELWQEIGESEGVDRACALVELSKIEWNKGKYQDSLSFCESARDLYFEAGPDVYCGELVELYYGIMNNAEKLDRWEVAADAASEIAAVYEGTGDSSLRDVLRDQARYLYACKKYQESLEVLHRVISMIDPDVDDFARAIEFLNIGMTYKCLERFDEAIDVLKQALAIFKAEKEPKWVSKCHGEFTEIYFELKNAEELEYWSRKALDYAELTADSRWEYWLNYYLGVALRMKDELDGAEEKLAWAREVFRTNKSEEWKALISIEKELAGICFIRGKVGQGNEILRRIATIEETLEAA